MTRTFSNGAGAMRRTGSGFTLIEVMVTVAIVAILASIALPAYNGQVARSRRADVQTQLLLDAQYMQRYYAANNTFKDVGSVTPVLPSPVSPKDGTAAYNIAVPAAARTDTTFTITATRTGAMTNDACGNFTYDDKDNKGLVNASSGQTVATCWR